MKDLLWILCTAGMAWGFVKSPLLKPFREEITRLHLQGIPFFSFMHHLFSCVGCMGFWSGMASYIIIFVLEIEILAYAFAGAIVSLLLVSIYQYIEKHR